MVLNSSKYNILYICNKHPVRRSTVPDTLLFSPTCKYIEYRGTEVKKFLHVYSCCAVLQWSNILLLSSLCTLYILYCVSTLGIDSVFSKIGCDATAITDMLGGHAGVTDNTVLQYLGIVEQRTNELLQLQAFIQAKVTKHGFT